LKRRKLDKNIRWFSLLGDYSRPDPPARLIDAVANGMIDVAIAWGPIAGYFARREKVRLSLAPAAAGDPGIPSQFSIAIAVRPGDAALRDQLNLLLRRHHAEIDGILRQYRVPRVTTQERQAD